MLYELNDLFGDLVQFDRPSEPKKAVSHLISSWEKRSKSTPATCRKMKTPEYQFQIDTGTCFYLFMRNRSCFHEHSFIWGEDETTKCYSRLSEATFETLEIIDFSESTEHEDIQECKEYQPIMNERYSALTKEYEICRLSDLSNSYSKPSKSSSETGSKDTNTDFYSFIRNQEMKFDNPLTISPNERCSAPELSTASASEYHYEERPRYFSAPTSAVEKKTSKYCPNIEEILHEADGSCLSDDTLYQELELEDLLIDEDFDYEVDDTLICFGSEEENEYGFEWEVNIDPLNLSTRDSNLAQLRRMSFLSLETKERADRRFQELISTEQVYLDRLRLLNLVFRKPLAARSCLKDCTSVTTSVQLEKIFLNLEKLIELSEKLLVQFEHLGKIGYLFYIEELPDLFRDYKTSFLTEFGYFSEMIPRSQGLVLYLCQNNPDFLQHVKTGEYCLDGHGMLGLLMEPIQRVTRYALILTALQRDVKESTYHRPAIQSAINILDGISEEINRRASRASAQTMLELLQERFFRGMVSLVNGERHCVRLGKLRRLKANNVLKDYFGVLCNDCLIFASTKKSRSKPRLKLVLGLLDIVHVGESIKENTFIIHVQGGFSVEFTCVSKKICIDWIQGIIDSRKSWIDHPGSLSLLSTNLEASIKCAPNQHRQLDQSLLGMSCPWE